MPCLRDTADGLREKRGGTRRNDAIRVNVNEPPSFARAHPPNAGGEPARFLEEREAEQQIEAVLARPGESGVSSAKFHADTPPSAPWASKRVSIPHLPRRAHSSPARKRGQQARRPYHRPIGTDAHLFSTRADQRLDAARALGGRGRRRLARQAAQWPLNSPGAINAWLLLVTTKPPVWRDPLVQWVELPPTLGQPHEGFFYPDPLGFWAETRRWTLELLRLSQPKWTHSEALSVTTLLHVADDAARLDRVVELCRPRLVLFLDESSWELARIDVRKIHHSIEDPHRPGQFYEGFWAVDEKAVVVGKAPQHPTTHNLYRAEEMAEFLRSAPIQPDWLPPSP